MQRLDERSDNGILPSNAADGGHRAERIKFISFANPRQEGE
jgi:hypothetical protein